MNQEQHMKAILQEIEDERSRQINVEGFSVHADDEYQHGELPRVAACYAFVAGVNDTARALFKRLSASHLLADIWPFWNWDVKWWKPTTPRRDLIKAAACIVAEIERIDRAENLKQRIKAQYQSPQQ